MSFLPAEEHDYDSDDGFCGTDNFDHYLHSEIKSSSQRQPHHQDEWNDTTGTQPYSQLQERRGFNARSSAPRAWVPSAHRSWAGYGDILSLEDLQKAAKMGVIDVIEKCIKQGLSVNSSLQCSWTALMYAANHGQAKAVELLLGHGADVHYHADLFTALMAASNATSGNEDDVTECVRLLLEAGSDANAKDRHHLTSLMMAGREGHLGALKLLLDHGVDVNAQDSRGWTALTWSTQRQRRDVVVALLDHGANPDIQHLDRLTVKDMAAHLPSDEMLSLLERRPIKETSKRVGNGALPNAHGDSFCILEGGDVKSKLTDLRYGELEMFLIGLELDSLVPLFQQQLIDLDLLMTLTEQDLVNAGVSQVGARKRLLDAVQAIHKKDWEPSALCSIHYNKQILCSDAVAMIANSSKHLRYIGSTVVYVKEQWRLHPQSILHPTDKVSPDQLLRHTEEALKNSRALCDQLVTLQKNLEAGLEGINRSPPDVIQRDCHKKRLVTKKTACALVLLSVTLPIVVLHRLGRLEPLGSSLISLHLWPHR